MFIIILQALMVQGFPAIAFLVEDARGAVGWRGAVDFRGRLSEPVAYQAMFAKVCAAGAKTLTKWNKFYDVMQFCATFEQKLDTLGHAFKPRVHP